MKKTIIYFIALLIGGNAVSQGCSDAGFCTAGSLKNVFYKNDSIKNSLNFSLNYSVGERGITIISPQFEPIVKVSDRSFVQIKIPYMIIDGNLGSNKGIGDVSLNYNYRIDSMIKPKISLTAGLKIPSGSAAVKTDGVSLPMPYQTSLGTTDILGGIKLDLIKGISVSLAFQIPMFNINQNKFDSSAFLYFKNQKNIETNKNYFISSNLKRKSDVMMRIDKVFKIKKINILTGLLPIYHLGNDKVNTSSLNQISLDGSHGLTLNFNANLNYRISKKSEINLAAAIPLITRKSRPDGLGRSMVTYFSFMYEL